MKKKLFITMSAIVALFFVVVVSEVFGWQSSCSTTFGSEWRECSTYNNPVTASSGGAAYVRVTAPGSTTADCDVRKAEAWLLNGTAPIQVATCPDGSCTGGNCQTLACCATASWTAVVNSQYYVYTSQSVYTGSTCGPTTGLIKNGSYNCNQEGPEGP